MKWANERTSERGGGRERSEQSGASKQVSGASKWANGRASGPVLQCVFLGVFDHSEEEEEKKKVKRRKTIGEEEEEEEEEEKEEENRWGIHMKRIKDGEKVPKYLAPEKVSHLQRKTDPAGTKIFWNYVILIKKDTTLSRQLVLFLC